MISAIDHNMWEMSIKEKKAFAPFYEYVTP
jgi:hypothetical protein